MNNVKKLLLIVISVVSVLFLIGKKDIKKIECGSFMYPDINNRFSLSIIIPAYNEQDRIERTLRAYYQFFNKKQQEGILLFEIVVVVNGCTDNTLAVVEEVKKELSTSVIKIINVAEGGKGSAIKTGFADALTRHNDIIGFVDADMATQPDAYYDLIEQLISDNFRGLSTFAPLSHKASEDSREASADGVIASRYMPGAQTFPPRPAYKRWGSRLIYEPLVKLLFGLSYYDLQCGAKVFKRYVLEKIVPSLSVRGWGFDVELLYLCKKNGYIIKEIPTVWTDQENSKLTLFGGIRMLWDLIKLRFTRFKS